MYKITLYDYCCAPFCDGTFSFFVDDLEAFERRWLPITKRREPERAERYLRSKKGEIVTDYYSDDPLLNILQEDKYAEVLEEKVFCERDLDIELFNAYRWSSEYHFDRLTYALRRIRFGGEELIAARYGIKGVCTEGFCGRTRARVWGNPICAAKYQSPAHRDPDGEGLTAEVFSEDRIVCFVWLPLDLDRLQLIGYDELICSLPKLPDKVYTMKLPERLQAASKVIRPDRNRTLRRLNKTELQFLLRDLPGEAG